MPFLGNRTEVRITLLRQSHVLRLASNILKLTSHIMGG